MLLRDSVFKLFCIELIEPLTHLLKNVIFLNIMQKIRDRCG